jgi:hypothetical protein
MTLIDRGELAVEGAVPHIIMKKSPPVQNPSATAVCFSLCLHPKFQRRSKPTSLEFEKLHVMQNKTDEC